MSSGILFILVLNYRSFYNEDSPIVEDYPVAWNKHEFEKISSFDAKLKYASSHLPRISSGTGRAVFKIDNEKALKIAKNKKGLAQNNVEREKYLQNYSITARTFDYGDEIKSIGPFWVEMEFAKKINERRFEELTGVRFQEFVTYYRNRSRGNDTKRWDEMDIENNEFVSDLNSLIADYDFPVGDMLRLSSYGEVTREGKPAIVLVDFGMTNTVFNDYYKVQL